ncbi:MAG: helix-hairpin-helix domain-containing protein, partial [Patescibacteria group bacterium]
MENREIEKILREIGEYLEMQGESFFKIKAYEKAADVVGSLSEKVSDIYEKGGRGSLEKISGIGISIAEKIEELIKTGRLKYYEQLKKEMPVNLSELERIQGLGAKSIYKLYKKLGITNLKELEEAVKKGKIRDLEGFGKKTEENISKGLEFINKSGSRFVLGEVMPLIKEIEHHLKKLKEVEDVVIAGSVRRKKETIGDVDILVISDNPNPVMDFFVSMSEVGIVYARGDTKSAIKLKNGLDVDLRVVSKESYGAALNYFTGSK